MCYPVIKKLILDIKNDVDWCTVLTTPFAKKYLFYRVRRTVRSTFQTDNFQVGTTVKLK